MKKLVTFLLLIPVLTEGRITNVQESFLQIYGSGALSTSGTLDSKIIDYGVGTARTETDLSNGEMEMFGVLWSGFWERDLGPRIGMGFDLSYFKYSSDAASTDIRGLNVSILLMVDRFLNQSEEFSEGRLRPYVGIGPCFIGGKMGTDARFPDGSVVAVEDATTGMGLDFRAGLEWWFYDKTGVFIEFRNLYIRLEPDEEFYFFQWVDYEVELEASLTAQLLQAGISITF